MKNAQTFFNVANGRGAAKGSLNMTKTIVPVLAALLLAASLPSLTGCRNTLQPQNVPETAPATGSLFLTIGQSRARTIQPDIADVNDFDTFSLELFHVDTGNIVNIPNWDKDPVDGMAAGNWELTVTAFLLNPAGSHVAAAQTGAPVSFTVSVGETTNLNVLLLPIPAGTGWFSWNLTFPGTPASMRITPLDGGTEIDGIPVHAGVPGNLELEAGQYRAHLTLHHDGETATISRILHVHPGMTSHWEEAFTEEDFHRTFLDYFLELWDGWRWNLEWVQQGHLDILSEEESIEGLIPPLIYWFNAIYRLPWHPGYNTADDLRTLVDAALIAMGVQLQFYCCCHFDEGTIRGWVQNGSHVDILYFWGWHGGRVAIGGVYEVWWDMSCGICGSFPSICLIITFDGNGYWGSTLPGSIETWHGDWIQLPVWYADREIDGYWFAFRGWSTNPDSTFPQFSQGEMFVVGSSNVTLYAIWSEYGFGFDDGVITGFSGGSSVINIPSAINGMPVTSIGPSAFADNLLTSVVIPGGVTYIGGSAFEGNLLTSITIPGGVDIATGTSMGEHGVSFLDYYEANGRQAGVYIWDGTQWILSNLVRIQGGTFLMGWCPTGGVTPMRYVTLSGFYMSRFQVTQGEWYEVMYHLPGTGVGTRRPGWFNGTNNNVGTTVTPTFEWRNLPVERVSWYDVLVFSNRLSILRGLTPAYSIGGSTNPDDWGPVPTSSHPTWNAVEIVPGSTGYRLPTEAQW